MKKVSNYTKKIGQHVKVKHIDKVLGRPGLKFIFSL